MIPKILNIEDGARGPQSRRKDVFKVLMHWSITVIDIAKNLGMFVQHAGESFVQKNCCHYL